MRTLRAFLGRDLAYQLASRFGILGQLLTTLMGCTMLYFLGKTFGPAQIPALRAFHGSYFEFALIGVIFARFQAVALNSFSAAIIRDQTSGTIESILSTRAGVPAVVLGASGSAFFFTTVQTVMFLLAGAWIFGVSLAHANVVSALVVLVLSICAISPIGISFAASIIAFRQGSGALGAVSLLTNVFGGVYFPISVLPLPLKWMAWAFPITHGLNGLRAALLSGATLAAIGNDVVILFLMAAIGLPLSILLFRAAIRSALRSGTLTYY